MNFFKPREAPAAAEARPPPPQQLLHQAFTSLQTHFSNFFQNLQTNRPLKNSFYARISNENNNFYGKSSSGSRNNNNFSPKDYAMSAEDIEERLAGVPVYALTRGYGDFVLVGTNTGKKLGLFCFNEADAEALLKEMKSVDPSRSSDSHVVPVPLSKIVQLNVDGVALRLMPEASQIKNALREWERAGTQDESFPGVPVFQSQSLILTSQNKRYRPVFFRKEDLEKSVSRAAHSQNHLNPILRQGDIQVAVLEEIIQGMKDRSLSSWNDVVFVPPGYEVSTDPSRLKAN